MRLAFIYNKGARAVLLYFLTQFNYHSPMGFTLVIRQMFHTTLY